MRTESYDIAAAIIETEEGAILLIAAYDYRDYRAPTLEREEALATKLDLIRLAIDKTRREQGREIESLSIAT